MDIILERLLQNEGKMRAFRAVTIVIVALIVNFGHSDIEHPLCSLDLIGYLREIGYFERRAVLSDYIHHGNIMKIEQAVLHTKLILRKLERLVDQINVLVLHNRQSN